MNQLEPKRVFHYFQEISKIPHCSGNEREISDYLVNFAHEHKLEVIQDELMNVIIKKPASKGYEHAPVVTLQGHMDMVGEKAIGSDHDFEKDALELSVVDGWVQANNTTLGADDGIAVAMGLAILEDDELKHPALELLITVEEETSMGGALGLGDDVLEGEMMINIDSEEEGILTAGCAGGATIYGDYKKDLVEEATVATLFKFAGLKGGHSGMEIHKNRGNILKIMADFVLAMSEAGDVKIGKFVAGSLDNAIPRHGELVLSFDKKINVDEVIAKVKEMYPEHEELTIEHEEHEWNLFWSDKMKTEVVGALKDLPTGVYAYLEDGEGVESSNNVASIKELDDEVEITISIRSSREDMKGKMRDEFTTILENNGFKVTLKKEYPSWEYRKDSPLRELASEVHKSMFGKPFEVIVIHAGLEAGVIVSKYPQMDIISIGPNITGAHTPKERLEIASTERVYKFLIKLLEEIK